MLVLTLILAAVGFALLVVALISGSVVWAWTCISVCMVGALVLLASALSRRDRPSNPDAPLEPSTSSEPPSRGKHARP